MKKIFKITIAIILIVAMGFATVVFYFGQIGVTRPEGTLHPIYEEPENTLDGVVIGSSAIYRYWIPALAYQETGSTFYTFASVGLPICAYKYIIEETMKIQNPKYIFIELRSIAKSPKGYNARNINYITQYMKPSMNRLALLCRFLEYDIQYNTDISKDIRRYRYKKFNDKESLKNIKTKNNIKKAWKGFVYDEASYDLRLLSNPIYTNEVEAIRFNRQGELDEFLEYCKTLNTKVFFVVTPFNATANNEKDIWKEKVLNYTEKYIKKQGFDVFNLYTKEDIEGMGLDYSTDFYNSKHVNFYGAEKFTKYITKLLDKKYDLPDHRGDNNYASWDEAVKTYENAKN